MVGRGEMGGLPSERDPGPAATHEHDQRLVHVWLIEAGAAEPVVIGHYFSGRFLGSVTVSGGHRRSDTRTPGATLAARSATFTSRSARGPGPPPRPPIASSSGVPRVSVRGQRRSGSPALRSS